MTRREQLLAALAEGDASHPELLHRMQGQGWNAGILRVHLSAAINDSVVWVCDLGRQSAKYPRRYTCDPSRSLDVAPVRKTVESNRPMNRTPARKLVAIAISKRTPLELAWVGGC